MATYAIGDLQGCYDELQDLLNEINFDARNDRLWFCGDIVNRGPKSLECLQFVMDDDNNAQTVLGNHDLHLLALSHHVRTPHRKDTLDSILRHEQAGSYLNWIRHQHLLLSDADTGFTLVHAGLLPEWSLSQATDLANEAECCLRGRQYVQFIQEMYGNEPDHWDDNLTGNGRLRCIINAMTRLRYLLDNNRINFGEKGAPGKQEKDLLPWYQVANRQSSGHKIAFGHWSTIYLGNEQNFTSHNVYPLDTGCLWGGKLSALRLEDEHWFHVPSRQSPVHT